MSFLDLLYNQRITEEAWLTFLRDKEVLHVWSHVWGHRLVPLWYPMQYAIYCVFCEYCMTGYWFQNQSRDVGLYAHTIYLFNWWHCWDNRIQVCRFEFSKALCRNWGSSWTLAGSGDHPTVSWGSGYGQKTSTNI